MLNILIEDASCSLFICAIGAVYACCLHYIRRIAKTGLRAYKFSWKEPLCFAAGLGGLICLFYGVFIEPFTVDITHVTITSSKLAPHSSPIRLVHISDMHSDGIIRTERRLPSIIEGLHPDVIVFTGDAANNSIGLKVFRACMTSLTKIAPVFAVYGNHDAHRGARWNIYGGTDVIRLKCDAKQIEIRNQPIWIGGVGIDKEKLMEQTLNSAPKDMFSIFLYHYPVGVQFAAAHNIDLICAGHTHGGQICLPLYGAIVTESQLGKQYESGLHRLGNTWCYINRGIGMTSIPARFLAPPEVTVIDIVPTQR